ncbi:MAG: hypothetical protein NZM25_08700 [Leptospiraceae bacterium]|nr:hypothetical protein [Leptospiraceae bacterium]MDW8306796.1 hypothetical protein [Leptospiraceae bacterium]
MIVKKSNGHGSSKGLWDLRLNPALMAKLRQAATKSNTSMSAVVRFCAFKLARKKVVDLNKMREMAHKLKEKNSTPSRELCRINVVLHGDDERLFCELKYRFGLTTSMVLRIALVRYLDSFLSGRIPYWRLFWYGTKLVARHKCYYSTVVGIPIMDFHSKELFSPEDYHCKPSGELPMYLRYYWQRRSRS